MLITNIHIMVMLITNIHIMVIITCNNHNGNIHNNLIKAQEDFPPVGEVVLVVREDLEMVAITAQAVVGTEAILEAMADVSPEAQVELPAPVPPRDRVEAWAGTPPMAPSAWTPTLSCSKRRSPRRRSSSSTARSMG